MDEMKQKIVVNGQPFYHCAGLEFVMNAGKPVIVKVLVQTNKVIFGEDKIIIDDEL